MAEWMPTSPSEPPEIHDLHQECLDQINTPPHIDGLTDTHHIRFVRTLGEEAVSNASRMHNTTAPMLAKAIRAKGYDGALTVASIRTSTNVLANRAAEGTLEWDTGTLDWDRFPWTTDSEWKKYAELIFDRPELMQFIADNILIRLNSTNEPKRAVSPKLTAHTFLPEKVATDPSEFSMLNVGSSFNYETVMLEANIPLPNIKVDFSEFERDLDELLWTTRIQSLLAKRVPLLRATGVDILPLNDPEWQEWGRACCYFLEMRGEERKKQRQRLDEIRDASPHIRHVAARFGHLDKEMAFARDQIAARRGQLQQKVISMHTDLLEQLDPANPYTLVSANTMFHLNRTEDQRKIFDEMVERTEPGGLVLITDFIKGFDEERDERRLAHPLERVTFSTPTSEKFRYVSLVYDPENPSNGLRIPWRMKNGRVGEIQPTRYGWSILRSVFHEDER